MNSLLKLWAQPSWIKWIVYLAIVYILFLIKEAFAIVLWFLFCIILYYMIFANSIFKTRTYYEKKDISIENKYDSIYNDSMKYYNYLKGLK